MIFFVALLYTAILGVLFEHSFHIGPHNGQPATNVNVIFYIRKGNVLSSGTLLVLFVVDWICFHILFGTTNALHFDPLNGWLLFAYLPALFCLGLTVIFSYERVGPGGIRRFCLTGCLYHLLALVAEVTWVLHQARQLSDSAGGIRFSLVIVLIVYFAFRGLIAFGYFHCYSHPASTIRPSILGFPSLFIKPAFLVGLSYTIPEILMGGQ